ncbi:MAG: hypothetical protein R3A47_07725 [Polyangiales bacterium]
MPIVIAGTTAATNASTINRALATAAEERGYGFGLGSQRAMARTPESAWTYKVRDVAPNALLFGNVGVVQARDMSTADVQGLVDEVKADALCVHMNPAMEIVQPEGDRDFRGGLDTFRRLWSELNVPVVAKETGNGIARATAKALRNAGIRYADTSGAGGTSWVGVETMRERCGRGSWRRTLGIGVYRRRSFDDACVRPTTIAMRHQIGARRCARDRARCERRGDCATRVSGIFGWWRRGTARVFRST